jgi:hypothetical protein
VSKAALYDVNHTPPATDTWDPIHPDSTPVQIKIGDKAYYPIHDASPVTDFSTGQFNVVEGGTAYDFADTAANLVQTINRDTRDGSIYYAYHTGSSSDTSPGQMRIEKRTLNGPTFEGLTIPSSVGTNYFNEYNPKSANDLARNRIYISNPDAPEEVKVLSFLDVGSANEPILRILALRDSVYVLKNDGIFRIIGEDASSFRVSLFDSTTKVIAPEAAVVTNNQIVCMTDQGVCAISDSGIQVLSRPIEKSLIEISSSLYPNFELATHACSYESERKYIMWTVHNRTDATTRSVTNFGETAYVYNFFSNAWTKWFYNTPQATDSITLQYPFATSSIVNSANNNLYFGHPSNGYVYKERKTYTSDDFADESIALSIANFKDGIIAIDPYVPTNYADYSIKQGSSVVSISSVLSGITGMNGFTGCSGYTGFEGYTGLIGQTGLSGNTGIGNILAIDSGTTFTVGPCTLYKPIEVKVKWVPKFGDNPAVLHQFTEASLFFQDCEFTDINVGFDSNWVTSPVYTNVPSYSTITLGGTNTQQTLRLWVPREVSVGNWINPSIVLKECFRSFSLGGLSLTYSNLGTGWR